MAETITSKDLFDEKDIIGSDVLFRNKPVDIVGEPPLRTQILSPEEEVKQIGNIIDWSDIHEVSPLTIEQLYEPIESLLKAVPDPKDVNIQAQEVEQPSIIKAAEEKKDILESFLGFRYPPKPPNWKYASLIEKFNFITLPISDVLGRIGGKIASGWRLMTKEDVQKLLVNELDEDLKWYQKTPEAIGWTSAKVAEFIALKGIFKVSGLHKALTVAGQKAAAPFIAKEITAAGGMKAVSTMSAAGLKGLVRKGTTSFLLAVPENITFISSWSALDAVMKGEDVKEAAISGAKWGAVLTAGFAAIAPITQVPELRLAFQKAIANVGKRFPGMLDKLGKPVTKEVEKEWLKALSKSRGKDVRLIDLGTRERQIFRNAIRAAEKEILKAAEREAAIQAYWGAKAAKVAAPAKPVTKDIVKIVEDKPVVKPAPTVPITAPEKPVAPITPEKAVEIAPEERKVVSREEFEAIEAEREKVINEEKRITDEFATKVGEQLKKTGVRIKPISIGILRANWRGHWADNEDVFTFYTNKTIGKEEISELEKALPENIKVFPGGIDFPKSLVAQPPTVAKAEPAKVEIEKEIKAHDIYQNELEAQGLLAEKFAGQVFVPQKYAGEVKEAVENYPALKFRITHDPQGGKHFDEILMEIGKPDMDISELFEWMAKARVTKAKIGKVNKVGLDAIAQTGNPYDEMLVAKYEGKLEGLTNNEINDNLREIALDYGMTEEEYKGSLIDVKEKQKVDKRVAEKGEKKKEVDLLGRPVLKGGVAGKQAEFLDKEKYRLPEPDIEGQMKLKAEPTKIEKAIDKKVLESDDLGISDKEGIDMMPKGIVITPNVGAARDTYNKIHDYMFTFGQAKREDPELYDELMKAFGKRNAGVERAIDQVGRIIPKEIKIDDDVNMAMVYEDKRLSPKLEQKETYDKFKALLDEMSKKQREEGLFSQPFNERMIEENNVKIEKLSEQLQHPNKSKQVARLRAENKILEEMRYLSHGIVAKRTIESKVNTLSGEKKTAYLQRLSAFYKKRRGKLFLKDYLESGLITKEDMRLTRLATEEVADYYVRSAYKGLYDYGKAKGYVHPFSEELHDEGWLTAKELGIFSPELKEQIVHPLFGSALAEMKAMRIGRGSFISQLFGAVKVGQFIKPTIVWVYDAVQKYMRGMYSFNPITEAKALTQAAKSVLTKDEMYHNLNESNLFQFPYEISKGARDEEIAKFINQHSAEIDRVIKGLEKTFDTRWLDPDTTLSDVIKKIVVAAHRGMAQITWAGDKIQRTQSYLILRKMGYPHDEAVKVAAASHGGYSLLSEKYKAKASKVLFVYSFRFLMPIEMGKTIVEPIKAAKDAMGGAKIPKHQWERMVKAVVGTAMIPIAIDEYMKWQGFEKEAPHLRQIPVIGKILPPVAWKWTKEVTVDGETREIVVGMNYILNMPVKYWNRITQYNPIDKTTRGLQVVKNLAKWEVHPIYRIWFWDISKNRRSFGSGVSVYDTEANSAVQFAQIAKYVFGQSFRFFGHTMDAIGEGNMTEKERAEQEKIFDSALTGADKMLFWALGYKYIRQPIEQRRGIMQKALEKELISRIYENARKYEGEELEKRKIGLKRWAEKCENWIQNEMK